MKVKRIKNFSKSQMNINLDDNSNEIDKNSPSNLLNSPANKESSFHPGMLRSEDINVNSPTIVLETCIDITKDDLKNLRNNRGQKNLELLSILQSFNNEVRRMKKRIPWFDRILTKIVKKCREICAPIKKLTQSFVECSPLNFTFLWITISFFLILSGHQGLMKQREIIYKQGEEAWLESYANNLKSEKDDLDAERDELRSEINFEKSNEKDNSIKDPVKQEDENLENIANDDDSDEDDLDAEGNELISEKDFEKSNENENYKQRKEFNSPIVNVNSTRSKNMDLDEERDVGSVKESANSKNEETKVESEGLQPFNRKKALMIAGVGLVGVFAIAIFVAIYRYRKNQHKDQIIQDKMKFDHSFHIIPVIFSDEDGYYDMV